MDLAGFLYRPVVLLAMAILIATSPSPGVAPPGDAEDEKFLGGDWVWDLYQSVEQWPKRRLTVEHIYYLDRQLVEPTHDSGAPAKRKPEAAAGPSKPAATHITVPEGTPLERSDALEKWTGPLQDGSEESGAPENGVDGVFTELEKQLAEEELEEPDEEEMEILTIANSRGRKKKALSLMDGDLYDFDLVKQALDNVVPKPVVERVDVRWVPRALRVPRALESTIVERAAHPSRRRREITRERVALVALGLSSVWRLCVTRRLLGCTAHALRPPPPRRAPRAPSVRTFEPAALARDLPAPPARSSLCVHRRGVHCARHRCALSSPRRSRVISLRRLLAPRSVSAAAACTTRAIAARSRVSSPRRSRAFERAALPRDIPAPPARSPPHSASSAAACSTRVMRHRCALSTMARAVHAHALRPPHHARHRCAQRWVHRA
ncbi:hypothetical protein GGX14DRAFT_674789 [Mycena pura]|uniref:Uncharacterized protein n=1 Tax=Mycena pura TaxID=153505 RepID=A0AAD6UX69_9AGAR|nr:hypothetical protein GGX14DRAFT_674789 [Mycena pura]